MINMSSPQKRGSSQRSGPRSKHSGATQFFNCVGFTLVEMLVALTVFSIMALSVSAVFRSGVRTWRAGNEWSEENQAARSLLSRDTLEKSVPYAINIGVVLRPPERLSSNFSIGTGIPFHGIKIP